MDEMSTCCRRDVRPAKKLLLAQFVFIFCFCVLLVFYFISDKLRLEQKYIPIPMEHVENILRFKTGQNHSYLWSNPEIDGIFTQINLISTTVRKKEKLSDEITVVTAYFDLGNFQKGHSKYYTSNMYRNWFTVVAKVNNPLVIFLEKDSDVEEFKRLRKHLNKNLTMIYKISREELWAFSIRENIKSIFESPGYPKHYPNTVMPEYSCAMHAKFELVRQTLMKNYAKTKYFAWMDIGCFRNFVGEQRDFHLAVPKKFNVLKIGYAEVYKRDPNIIPKDIFQRNMVWVGGAFFLGRIDQMLNFTKLYMLFVEEFLKQGVMNTDQQVLYAATNSDARFFDLIQVFHGNGNPWFFMGTLCKRAGSKNKIKRY